MQLLNILFRLVCNISSKFIGPKLCSVKVSSHTVSKVNIKVYSPEGARNKPVILYYHGGGWVIGSINSYDRIFRYISFNSGCIVVAIEYRKAPEYKFPIAMQDSYLGYIWAINNIYKLNGDINRLVLCGDSAGCNLILGVLAIINKQKVPKIPYLLVLIYPLLEPKITPGRTRSWLYKISNIILDYSLRQYLTPKAQHNIQQISFISNFDKNITYPTTLIFTAQLDALTPDINRYSSKLKSTGTKVFIKEYPGAFHGAINFSGICKVSKAMLSDISKHIVLYCR
jgi:acetyl esterase